MMRVEVVFPTPPLLWATATTTGAAAARDFVFALRSSARVSVGTLEANTGTPPWTSPVYHRRTTPIPRPPKSGLPQTT